jgi:tetratricopeptide (TPR) repeat protein
MPDDTLASTVVEDRFEHVLAGLLQAEEHGEPLDLTQVIRAAPELETRLREFYANRDSFDRLAPQLAPTAGRPAAGTAQPELPPGSRFGGYELLHKLGEGGRGLVYRVSDPELNRPLAVKVLRPELRDEPDAVRRFLEEAQVTGQLQHPGIVPVHAIGRLPDGRPFFTMKLVRGHTLAQLLAGRPTPADDLPCFVGIFQQVCQAVAYAHSRGVIHRDLKPSNVMVGAFAEVQVMDWGLAKVLTTEVSGPEPVRAEPGASAAGDCDTVRTVRTEASGLSSSDGLVVGTIAYMSPEQAKGRVEQFDRRTDVFGLGAILCEVLTGQPPYTGAAAWKLHLRAAAGDLADAFARLDRCGADAELIALARECLAPDRTGRPGDAGATAGRVAAYLDGVQERLREAERQRAAAEARAEGERRARRLLLGLAAAVLLLVLLGGGGAGLVEQQRAAALAHRQRTEQETRLIRDRARGLLEAGWEANDLGKLQEALAEAERAADVARSGSAGAAVQQEAVVFRDEVAARLRRLTKDRELLTALLNVSAPHETGTYTSSASGTVVARAGPSADEQYAAAFRRWGLDMDRTAEATVVAQLHEEPAAVVQEVVAGLDSWMLARRRQKRPEAEWRRLFQLAQQLDRSARHHELRALLVGESAPEATSVAGLVGGWPPWPALWELTRGARWRRLQELRGRVNAATEPVLTVVLLAQVCAAVGDRAGAEQVLREALAARPGELVLLEALGGMLELEGRPRLGEAIECYRAARALRPYLGVTLCRALNEAGRSQEEEKVLRDLVRRQPESPELRLSLGAALYVQGKLPEAVAAWRKAIALRPDYMEAYNNLGVALRAQGRLDEAVAACHKAIALQPDNAVAYYNLGNALRDQGKLAEAVAACHKAIALQPDYASAYITLGTALDELEKPSEAVAPLQKAIALRPDDAVAYTNLGSALDDLGQLAEAVAACQKAIALQPDNAEAYSNLGDALHDQGKLAEAVAAYHKAIALQPALAEPYYNLGNTLRDQGRLAEAVTAYRKAVTLKPDFAEAHCNLGLALLDQGEFADALVSLKRGHGLGSRRSAWPYAFADWIRRAERLVQLDSRLANVLGGESQPADAAERIELAELCRLPCKQLYAAAACFYRDALAAEPKRADDPRSGHRYHAACAAALAGCGRGRDADRLGSPERAHWRQQAHDWLRADLAAWGQALATGKAPAASAVQQTLRQWQTDADLAGVRDKAELSRLAGPERGAWENLWAEVEALRQRAQETR